MQKASSETPVLRINLDETSLCVHQSSSRGILCVDRSTARGLKRHVPRGARRLCLTYVAAICDRDDIQDKLPQYLIGNEVTIKAKSMPTLVDEIGPGVRLLRRKSAWCNQETMIEIVRDVAEFARSRGLRPLLLWDAARPHITPRVLGAAHRAGVWISVVPAGTTHLLQPLDTHCFARFKRCLAVNAAQLPANSLKIYVEGFLRCAASTIRCEVLKRSWSHAFAANGYGEAAQANISDRVRSALELSGRTLVSHAVPELIDISVCFPKRVKLDGRAVLAPFLPAVAPRQKIRATAAKSAALREARLLGRTRSQTQALRREALER